MRTIYWKVEYPSPPSILRHCKKCGKTMRFFSSGLFRVNANGRYLDIWLIYRCESCQTTWNMEVYSRISPQGLPASLLQGFETSDSSLAMRYALDFALLKRNGAVPGEIPFTVVGEDLAAAEETRLHLSSEYPSPVRVSAVLRQKLGWSAKQFERAMERKQIVSADGRDLKKCRMSQDWIIICRPESM